MAVRRLLVMDSQRRRNQVILAFENPVGELRSRKASADRNNMVLKDLLFEG
jgi:hypothetical protein